MHRLLLMLLAYVWVIPSVHAQIKDYGLKEYVYTSKDLPHSETKAWTLVCQLPYNAQFTPWIQVKADSAGQVITCDSSNPLARCRETPQRYTTVSGDQSYEAPKWISGEGAMYTIPAGVTVLAVKYRETGFDTQVAGSFSCNDNDYSSLWQKATRTCYLCMRDSYMDCPDRERAEWLGDAVLQMEEGFYAFDLSSHEMAKRFIRKFQVNGLPGQNLIAHGEYGDWTYYLYTGDLETLSLIYPKTKKYLDQYQLGQDGLTEHRKEDWDWYDWGSLQDYPVGDARIASIATELWDGKRIAAPDAPTLMSQADILPDFEGPVQFTHRQTPDADIYFLANPDRKAMDCKAIFRVSGRNAEIWHPDTGAIKPATVIGPRTDGRTELALHFDPAGSLFVVFRNKVSDSAAIRAYRLHNFQVIREGFPAGEVRSSRPGDRAAGTTSLASGDKT